MTTGPREPYTEPATDLQSYSCISILSSTVALNSRFAFLLHSKLNDFVPQVNNFPRGDGYACNITRLEVVNCLTKTRKPLLTVLLFWLMSLYAPCSDWTSFARRCVCYTGFDAITCTMASKMLQCWLCAVPEVPAMRNVSAIKRTGYSEHL